MSNTLKPNAIEQELQDYISGQVVRRGGNVALSAPLVESGLVDSLGLIQIVAHITSRYGVNLTQAGGPDDFRSITTLAQAVTRERGGAES